MFSCIGLLRIMIQEVESRKIGLRIGHCLLGDLTFNKSANEFHKVLRNLSVVRSLL